MAGEIPMDFGMCVPIDHPSHPQLDHTPQRPLRCFVSRACCRGPASRADRARSIVTGATGNVRVPCRANILIGNRCAAATAEAADPDRGPAPGPAARSRSFLLSFARASTSREVAVTGRHSVLMGERWWLTSSSSSSKAAGVIPSGATSAGWLGRTCWGPGSLCVCVCARARWPS
jgi:hypothetical protein